MAGPPRLFIAVPLPDPAREDARRLLDGVRAGETGRGARWVRMENLHLTLRFLGATPEERIDAVVAAIQGASADRPAFDVALAGGGSFPSGSRPRALWLGIEQGATELAAIAAALSGPLEELGWPPETRPFRPHLTVARTDAVPLQESVATASTLAEAAAGWRTAFRADRVVLYRSHLGGGPPRYEPLATVTLSPGGT
jgi:2'-5' RNA ligase